MLNDSPLTAPGMRRATPEEIAEAREFAADGENIQIDDDAMLTSDEEGEVIWIQAWIRLNP